MDFESFKLKMKNTVNRNNYKQYDRDFSHSRIN